MRNAWPLAAMLPDQLKGKTMAKIKFKVKPEPVTYVGDTEPSYYRLKIPTLARTHCDMPAFRVHPKYGPYANSDMFPGMLKRIKADIFRGKEFIRLDDIPPGVSVDTSSFLAVVSFDV